MSTKTCIVNTFYRAKKTLGNDDRYVFYSRRKTVSTMLEQAGVFENVAIDILGHEKSATLNRLSRSIPYRDAHTSCLWTGSTQPRQHQDDDTPS